eukprot:m.187725 g.187725  ORF g.187725 m.187725 type:complete len:71 (+) comp14777_c0_seq3:157-369(+)
MSTPGKATVPKAQRPSAGKVSRIIQTAKRKPVKPRLPETEGQGLYVVWCLTAVPCLDFVCTNGATCRLAV